MRRFLTVILVLTLAGIIGVSLAVQAGEVVQDYPYMVRTAWSPDGNYIVFASKGDLQMYDFQTDEVRCITENIPDIKKYNHEDGENYTHPFFSADSKELYFTQWNPYNPNDESYHVSHIRAINIETGGWRSVMEDACWGSLSQDDRYLLYSENEKQHVMLDYETGEKKAYDFSDKTVVPNEWYDFPCRGSFHPDNTHYITNMYALDHTAQHDELNDKDKIYKVDLETGEPELVPIPDGLNYSLPLYSPDGTKILVMTFDYYPEPSTTRDPDTYALYEEVFNEMNLYYIGDVFYEEYGVWSNGMVKIETYEDYLTIRETDVTIWNKPDNYDDYMSIESLKTRPNEEFPRFTVGLGIYDTVSGDFTRIDPGNYFSADSGSWSPDGTQICYVLRNELDSFCTLNVYDIETGAQKVVVNGIKTQEPTEVASAAEPTAFAITGNYPNPFNPTTTIEFTLEKAGDVRLDIFNVMGQKVCALESARMTPGTHAVVWNGCDDKGKAASSGVYICRMKMGEAVQSKAMLLAK